MFQNHTRFKLFILSTLLITALGGSVFAQQINRSVAVADSSIQKTGTKPGFRWVDSYLNRFSFDLPRSPLFFVSPDSLKTSVLYSPENNNIEVSEKLTKDINAKIPAAMSFNEYSSIQNAAVRQSILRDYERLQDGSSNTSGRGLSPLLKKSPIIDKIFGGKAPEFEPIGFLSLDLKVGRQFVNIPSYPINQRTTTIFDLKPDLSINFNNNANSGSQGGDSDFQSQNSGNNLGGFQDLKRLSQAGSLANRNPYREKMGILGNFDTKSAFSTDTQFKINFKSEPEDILQSLEAGNVSFPLRSQLVPGVENLLGVKAGLRFGKLDITTVIAQQKSRTESVIISGGAQNRPFELRADEYDENRHFFLSHFFRNKYESSLKNLPMVTSGVIITRVEAYVTNRTKTVGSMRNLVGVADLGDLSSENSTTPASNDANTLKELLNVDGGGFRQIDNTNSSLELEYELKKGVDFEILRGAKRLTDREFEFNPQLGYISLLTPLRNDEILAVSYEYTYQGRSYKVGELTEDYSFRKEDDVILLKLLKSSTIRNRLDHPMWNLMMKNVYSLSQGQVEQEGFQLRVIYKDDDTGMDVPSLQEGVNLKEVPLISVLGLDRLNYNNDRESDGNFDYVAGVTINEQRGTIFFPVLEPFGSFLESKFDAADGTLSQKYVFDELYSRTKTDAQQVNTKNKFFLNGSVQSNSTEIPLPIGATGGSVRVYSGGTELQRGSDYTVDTQLGRIRITNPSILASGRSIRIDYERPDLFQSQIRRLFGIRMDYTVSNSLRIGATLMDLKENTPGFLSRTSIGNEPVNNSLWGVDLNFKKEGNGLTRILDKLPLIQTKEPSAIILNAEFAQLLPGVNNKKIDGNSMIDDFEAARTINDLTRQPQRWRLGSTPEEYIDRSAGTYGYNYNRAKISAYTIDQGTFLSSGFGTGNNIVPPELTAAAQSNLYERSFRIQDIFPGTSSAVLGQNLPTAVLDISYFPKERGMYNYNPNLNKEGYFEKPENNFGAVMRGITFDADFDNANVEYLEFWMLDPFKDNVRDGGKPDGTKNADGGKLVFHLGDISEDVIPDNRFNFENGLPAVDSSLVSVNSLPAVTEWGKAPRTQFMTDAFDNSDSSRIRQDIGLEGLSNEEERKASHIAKFLEEIKGTLDPAAYNKILEDPSADDYKFFLDNDFQNDQFIVERFKNYLGMENNSPLVNTTDQANQASTVKADKEDINEDNTINDVESYWRYEVDLDPSDFSDNSNYENINGRDFQVIDKVSSGVADWYLFRIPLDTLQARSVGNIQGFKSIRFMRMVMEGWKEPVVLRFAALQLVSNQYRTYKQDLSDNSFLEVPEAHPDTKFTVSSVSVEENGCPENQECSDTEEIPYVVPPGFIRDRDFSLQTFSQFNEQSVSLAVEGLHDGEKRAIFKNTDLDLNMYKRLQLFVHAHKPDLEIGGSKSAGAFIRLGSDLKRNYYEIEIEDLEYTDRTSTTADLIWPEENNFDIAIDDLRSLKLARNQGASDGTPFPLDSVYTQTIDVLGIDAVTRTYKISVIGNPDLSSIQTTMFGVSNPKDDANEESSFTVWFDEFRVNGFDETNGEAAVLSADIKLADLGTVSISGNFNNYGFGGVQDRISTRSRETSQGFGVATSLELDKFFPMKWGLSIPLFMNYDKQQIIPEFDPLAPDLLLKDAMLRFDDPDAYRSSVIDETTNKGFNFTNVRKIKTDPSAKNHIYDIENFTLSYAQNSIERTNVLIQDYVSWHKRGGLSYQFQPRSTLWEPFSKSKKLVRPMFTWLKDINLSPIPNLIAFRTDFDRSFTKTQYRSYDFFEDPTNEIEANYIQYFLTNRYYDVQWDLTKSISLTYNARMNSIIDETYGEDPEKNSLWKGLASFGRAKNYNQSLQATYRLPLDKFFLLDWVKADARYITDFNYRANAYEPLLERSIVDEYEDEFGNFIDNNREFAIQGKLDLIKLYNKLKYLKFANSPNQPKERFTRAPGDDEDIVLPSSDLLKTFTRLLMTVRGINFNFSIDQSTILPGFLGSPDLLGIDKDMNAPGIPFALFGSQSYERNDLGQNQWLSDNQDWLSKSSIRNDPFTQNRQKKFDYSTNLEPFKGFRMQIRGNYAKGDSYQELYRPSESGGDFVSQNPFRNGTFSMSFWSFKTGFTQMDKDPNSNYQYDIFDKLVDYREAVMTKLNELNNDGETGGYHINSQDVLIPAFFAAYSGKSVDEVFEKSSKRGNQTFNPFLQVPLPNWRVDYSGLEKLPVFNKLFSSISLSHSYTSTYSVGNYTSSLDYGANIVNLLVNDYSLGDLRGSTNNYFTPVFIMSNITMEERFSPLIGVQFTTKGSVSGRVEINRERRATLNLGNSQVAEYNSNDIVFGIGLRKNNVKLPFKGRDGNNVILTNNLNVRLDLTIKDITAIQRRLDGDAVPIQGNKVVQIRPVVNYDFNKKLSMGFYLEHFVNEPFTSETYEIRRTVGGINMKFNLAD